MKYTVLETKIDHLDPIIRYGIHDFEIVNNHGSFDSMEEAYEWIDDAINVLIEEFGPLGERLHSHEEVMLGRGGTRKWSGVRYGLSTEYWYTIEEVME